MGDGGGGEGEVVVEEVLKVVAVAARHLRRRARLAVVAELVAEGVGVGEAARVQQVEKRVQFAHRVLHRRPGEEGELFVAKGGDSVARRALLVLQALRLVDHHVLPRHRRQPPPRPLSAEQGFVRRHDHMEVVRRRSAARRPPPAARRPAAALGVVLRLGGPQVVEDHFAVGGGAVEHYGAELGAPRVQLALPVLDRRERRHDEERAADAVGARQLREGGDNLRGFTEPHLVSEHHVAALLPSREQPVDAIELYGEGRAG